MRLGRLVVAVASLGCGLSAGGCGDDSDDDGASNGAEQGVDWSTVNPPSNIDITSCYDITYETDEQFFDECSPCCEAAGFSTSGSINDDHCTCAAPPDDDRDTVCAAEASPTTSASCETCCTNAGFSGYGWVGGTAPQCRCHGKSDSAICADALDHPVPDEMCSFCCLENGFIGSGYVGFGEEECICISP
jgi:hypothetical protein